MAITERRLTLEQFLKLPEEEPALEYVDGAATPKMSPKGPHGALQFFVLGLAELFRRLRARPD